MSDAKKWKQRHYESQRQLGKADADYELAKESEEWHRARVDELTMSLDEAEVICVDLYDALGDEGAPSSATTDRVHAKVAAMRGRQGAREHRKMHADLNRMIDADNESAVIMAEMRAKFELSDAEARVAMVTMDVFPKTEGRK